MTSQASNEGKSILGHHISIEMILTIVKLVQKEWKRA